MAKVNRSRKLLYATVALAIVFFAGWLFWHSRFRTSSAPVLSSTQRPTSSHASGADLTPTTLYAHNLRLLKGPNFRVYVRWIRGQMLRTNPHRNPSLDDPESFVLNIQKGVVRANIGDIANYLNDSSPANAPLKNISVQPDGDQLKLHGTAHKLHIPLPVELTGQLSPGPNGRVHFHVLKISVLKIPMKALLGSFHLELSDLVPSANMAGIQIAGNDIDFDTQVLLPPPHIRGQITSIRVATPDVEVVYGNTSTDAATLAQWHNFFRLRGGSIDFGKLTMRQADITMIDTVDEPWFNLDLVNYQTQLVNGYTRMTPQAGLEMFMPGSDVKAPGASKGVTLPWLKDRNRALPPGVPVKK
jgi:hypothetical protein